MILKLNDLLKRFFSKKLLVDLNFLKEDFVSISILNGYAYCKLGDFVIFYCDIPETQEAEIELKPFHSDYLLAVCDPKGIYIISLSTKKQHYFEGAKKVVIDDVLNVGHEQLVIHFQERCLITDFKCCNHETGLDSNTERKQMHNLVKGIEKPSPHPSVIRSLEYKISGSISQGQVLESNIRGKKDLIQQCWESLTNLSLDQESCKPKLSTLTKLFSKHQPNNLQKNIDEPFPEKLQFHISTKWMQKFGDKLVFSYSVKNFCQTFIKVSDLSLSFCSVNKHAPTLSCTSSEQSVTSNVWEKRSDKEFLVSLDIPSTVIAANLNLNVNLHLRLNNKHYSIHLTSFKVSRSDILTANCSDNKEYHLRDAEDKLTFEFLYSRKCFTLQSKITPLDKVFNIICNRLNCTKLLLGNLTILLLPHNVIHGEIRLQNGRDLSEGVIYASSTEKLALLISEIQNMLPCDVAFQPLISNNQLKGVQEKLLKEVSLHENFARNLILNDDVIILDSPSNEICNGPKSDTLTTVITETDQTLIAAYSL